MKKFFLAAVILFINENLSAQAGFATSGVDNTPNAVYVM